MVVQLQMVSLPYLIQNHITGSLKFLKLNYIVEEVRERASVLGKARKEDSAPLPLASPLPRGA